MDQRVLPLLCFIAIDLLLSLSVQSDGRYLRPSDHGLAYQDGSTDGTGGKAPEMLTFFNGGKTVSLLPEAKNVTGGGAGEAWWKNRERRVSRDARRSEVRRMLVVASLVCGLTGVVLVVVSAVVFLIRIRYRKQQRNLQLQPQLGAEWSKHMSLSTHESTSALASA